MKRLWYLRHASGLILETWIKPAEIEMPPPYELQSDEEYARWLTNYLLNNPPPPEEPMKTYIQYLIATGEITSTIQSSSEPVLDANHAQLAFDSIIDITGKMVNLNTLTLVTIPPYQAAINAGFNTGAGFTMSLKDEDRNVMSQFVSLANLHLDDHSWALTDTMVTIGGQTVPVGAIDKVGNFHPMNLGQMLTLCEAYGDYVMMVRLIQGIS